MHRSIVSAIGVVLLAIGIALIGVAPRADVTATPTTAASASPSPSAAVLAATATPEPTIVAIPDGYRVQVPRLAINLPIAEGNVQRDTIEQQTPENFAFHLPGTALPGAGSNTYLYAHARRGMFLSLWNARVGDEVVITTPAGDALRYVVSEVHPRVSPQDTAWIQPTPSERVTLQTSTGPHPEDPRFVVVAVP